MVGRSGTSAERFAVVESAEGQSYSYYASLAEYDHSGLPGGPDSYNDVEVRYEALCAEPRESFRRLFAFSGLAAGEAELAGIPAQPLSASEAWRRQLAPEEIATIEKSAGDLLAELGYVA